MGVFIYFFFVQTRKQVKYMCICFIYFAWPLMFEIHIITVFFLWLSLPGHHYRDQDGVYVLRLALFLMNVFILIFI